MHVIGDAVSFIHGHNSFVIITHTRPDGDAVGSAVALKLGLQQLGKKAQVLVPSPVPNNLSFMSEGIIEDVAKLADFDAIIIVDTCSWVQLGSCADWFKAQTVDKLVLDHHMTVDDLGAIQIVLPEESACAMIIYYLLCILGVETTPEIANPLFAGIALDTGWFKHSNTNIQVFKYASELLAFGANPTELYGKLYESNSLAKCHLNGFVLSNLQTEGEICWATVTNNDFIVMDIKPADVGNLVSYTMGVEGISTGVMFLEEQKDHVKVSLRSHKIDCSKVAKLFDGGGHIKAAGFVKQGSLAVVQREILEAVKQELTCIQQQS